VCTFVYGTVWSPLLRGSPFHAINSSFNLELFSSTNDYDAPQAFANYYTKKYPNDKCNIQHFDAEKLYIGTREGLLGEKTNLFNFPHIH